jgi:hypothetical protein
VFDALPKDHELELSGLANTAMHNHGIASQSKDSFALSFVESGALAGLIERVGTTHVRIPSNGPPAPIPVDDDIADDEAAQDRPATTPPPVRSGLSAPPATAPANAVVNHSWPIEGGVIRFTIETSITLPATAYGVVGTVITAGDKLAELLTPAPTAPIGDSSDPE